MADAENITERNMPKRKVALHLALHKTFQFFHPFRFPLRNSVGCKNRNARFRVRSATLEKECSAKARDGMVRFEPPAATLGSVTLQPLFISV